MRSRVRRCRVERLVLRLGEGYIPPIAKNVMDGAPGLLLLSSGFDFGTDADEAP
jgi:hypothetical protein